MRLWAVQVEPGRERVSAHWHVLWGLPAAPAALHFAAPGVHVPLPLTLLVLVRHVYLRPICVVQLPIFEHTSKICWSFSG